MDRGDFDNEDVGEYRFHFHPLLEHDLLPDLMLILLIPLVVTDAPLGAGVAVFSFHTLLASKTKQSNLI